MSRHEGFSGFLRRYCSALCGLEGKATTSVKKLYRLVSAPCPTASEALFLYAVDTGRIDELMRYAGESGQQRFESYAETYSLLRGEGSAQEFVEANLDRLDERYVKVYNAWRSKRDRFTNERHVKSLLLAATKQALGTRRGAAHRVCRELGLNSGNFYAYLGGNTDAVSLGTARAIYDAARG